MDKIERLKIVVEGIEELMKQPVEATTIERLCLLTGCLVAEAKKVVEEAENKKAA